MEDIRGVRLRTFKLRKIVLEVRMHFRHNTIVTSFASVTYKHAIVSNKTLTANLL